MKKHRIKHIFAMLLACLLIISNSSIVFAAKDTKTQDNWPEGPSVTAKSAIVMDASTGLVLYEKNSTEAMYPASITKILTTLLAIENSSLTDTVTFSRDSIFNVARDSSLIGIDVGEELSLEDCLYAVMLESDNSAAYAVAEHVGGTYENFIKMMNDKVKELGCVDTHFNNPHGLPDENHYTCAYDMALISREAIRNTTFAKIIGTRTYTIAPTNIQSESRPIANHHNFILYPGKYEGALGGKTGWTSKAGYTLVTFARRNGMTLISVVMASDSSQSQYTDSASLLDFGFNNFTLYSLSDSSTSELLEDSPFFTKYSTLFSSSSSLLSAGSDGYVVLPNSAKLSDATRTVTFAPLSQLEEGNNTIGTVTYTYQDHTVGQTDIIYHNEAASSLPTVSIGELSSSSSSYLSNSSVSTNVTASKKDLKPLIVLSIFLILGVLVFLYYILVARPRARKKRAYYKRRKARRNSRGNGFY